jgi:antitoxin YefM
MEASTMGHVNYTELRQNLARYMDEVCDSNVPIVVTRQNARSVVMISEDEFESMMETLHLVRSPRNARRLIQSMEDAAAGRVTERDLIEVEEDDATPSNRPDDGDRD